MKAVPGTRVSVLLSVNETVTCDSLEISERRESAFMTGISGDFLRGFALLSPCRRHTGFLCRVVDCRFMLLGFALIVGVYTDRPYNSSSSGCLVEPCV